MNHEENHGVDINLTTLVNQLRTLLNQNCTYFTVPCFRNVTQLVNLNDCLARIEYARVGEEIMDVYYEECCIWSKIYTTNIGIYNLKSSELCFRNGGMVVFHIKHQKYSFRDLKANETKGLFCSYHRKYIYCFGNEFSYTLSLVALEGMKSLDPSGSRTFKR